MAEVEPINRVVLVGGGGEAPAVPESFRHSLRQYDPALLISWNIHKRRFVIEQCVQHMASSAEHTHLCRRVYVCMAQDGEGAMMPLGERVMDMIRELDTRRAGFGPEDKDRFLAAQREVIRQDREERDRKRAQIIREGTRDNKMQLRKALHLIQQHDLAVNQ